MKNTARFLSQISLIGAVFCAGCQKESAPPSATKSASPSPAPSAMAPKAEPALVEPASSALAPPAPAPVPEELGAWADGRPYKFRVTSLKRCSAPAADKTYSLAVGVDIFSKYDQLLVRGRDLTLENGGIILKSEIEPKVTPECGALLQTKQIQREQTLSGAVVFQIPPEFDARTASIVYKATRWGGSPRVEIKMPACFDACGVKGAKPAKPR